MPFYPSTRLLSLLLLSPTRRFASKFPTEISRVCILIFYEHRRIAIHLVQQLGWVLKTQERKKKRIRIGGGVGPTFGRTVGRATRPSEYTPRGFTSSPARAGDEVWIFGFHTNKQTKKSEEEDSEGVGG